jgi:hypothetical protein
MRCLFAREIEFGLALDAPDTFTPQGIEDEEIGLAFLAYLRHLLSKLRNSMEVQAAVSTADPNAAPIGSAEWLELGIESKYGATEFPLEC